MGSLDWGEGIEPPKLPPTSAFDSKTRRDWIFPWGTVQLPQQSLQATYTNLKTCAQPHTNLPPPKKKPQSPNYQGSNIPQSCVELMIVGIFIINLLRVGREETGISYMGNIGIVFPSSLLTSGKLITVKV